jgi:hypothetical protein
MPRDFRNAHITRYDKAIGRVFHALSSDNEIVEGWVILGALSARAPTKSSHKRDINWLASDRKRTLKSRKPSTNKIARRRDPREAPSVKDTKRATRSSAPKNCVKLELAGLKGFVEEYFPADAAGIDTSKSKDVIRLARALLERLWRFEN